MKAKTDNLKWHLFRWSFKTFKLFFTYINRFLASFSVLFKHKPFFINLSLFLHRGSKFGWNIFKVLPKLQRPALKVHVLWCKTCSCCSNLSKTLPWCVKINFQFHFFAVYSIAASILSLIIWKAPPISWPSSELAMFFNIDPWCFGPFGKFQDTKEISM